MPGRDQHVENAKNDGRGDAEITGDKWTEHDCEGKLTDAVIRGARDGRHSSRVLGQHYLLPRVRDIPEGRALVRTGPHANVASRALRTAAAA